MMLRNLNSASELFVNRMNQISQRMSRAQNQISTGVRVNNVSDEPDSVSTLLQVRAEMASNDQIASNLSQVKTETDTGEQALRSSVDLMEKARVLSSQGLTGTANAETRASIAGQIGSIMEQMVSLSRTTVGGRYIFSGDADG